MISCGFPLLLSCEIENCNSSDGSRSTTTDFEREPHVVEALVYDGPDVTQVFRVQHPALAADRMSRLPFIAGVWLHVDTRAINAYINDTSIREDRKSTRLNSSHV